MTTIKEDDECRQVGLGTCNLRKGHDGYHVAYGGNGNEIGRWLNDEEVAEVNKHRHHIADLRQLVDFLAANPRIAAAVNMVLPTFYESDGLTPNDVLTISDAVGVRPVQSPVPSEYWIDRKFGSVELHISVPKAACGREVTTWEMDERLRPPDPANFCTICGKHLGLNSESTAITGDGDGRGQRFAHLDCYRQRETAPEPPEVAAVLTPDELTSLHVGPDLWVPGQPKERRVASIACSTDGCEATLADDDTPF